jgi:MotA/TolQ/ExbB proton channel family
MTNSYASAAADFAPRGGGPNVAHGRGGLPTWLAALYDSDGAAQRYLLLMRFAVLNLVALALLGAAWLKGWIGLVVAGDSTHQVLIICLVFAYGLISCGHKVLVTSSEINQVREPERYPGSLVALYLQSVRRRDGHARTISASSLRLKLATRISSIRHIANSLVILGLIGTVIGFIISLSGVDPATAADVSAIAPMVTTLIAGMSIALYTTLVGAVLNVWLMLNYRLLEGGTVTLVTSVIALGESDANA